MNNPIVPATDAERLIRYIADVSEAIEPALSEMVGVRISYSLVTHQADTRMETYASVSASTWAESVPSGNPVVVKHAYAWMKTDSDVQVAISTIGKFLVELNEGDSGE